MPKGSVRRTPEQMGTERVSAADTDPLAGVAVGIDHSLASTGLVAVQVRTGEVVSERTVRPASTGVLRLQFIRQELQSWLASLPPIAHVCMEDYGFDATSRHSHLGEAGGVIKLALWEFFKGPTGFPSLPTSNQVKKFATGTGAGSKDQMRLGVYKRWGFEHRSNDVVDAYALAQLARALVNPGLELTSFQAEVVKVMRVPPKKKGRSQPPRFHAEMPADMRYDTAV